MSNATITITSEEPFKYPHAYIMHASYINFAK